MATTGYATGNALTNKLWAKGLWAEALKKTQALKFIGTSASNIIQYKDDTSKKPGDKITIGLRMQLAGDGVAGDGTLEGNEEALTLYNDSILIDQLRNAVRTTGEMSEQRVNFSTRDEARLGLADWYAGRIDTAFFNQLCGATAVSDLRYTGQNATIAADSDHRIYAGSVDGSVTTVTQCASASASCAFSLTAIDHCIEKAKTLSPVIKPIKIMGGDYYCIFLHPTQVTAMRTSTDTGQWLDIQKAAMSGGVTTKNPIFTGSLGMYNNTVIHESTYIPLGESAGATVANSRAAVFTGAQAGLFAMGRKQNVPGEMSWTEELFDYKNQLGVAAGCIFGIKKSVFNSKDFATIQVNSYATSA